ncbi:hypothetical protein SK128_026899 [Halocaridina rubra]|uniref:Decapping nuclease n=1 Tax=Halocaridina rubra TaxID=373956 RepID=A0AAN9A449_HALRR
MYESFTASDFEVIPDCISDSDISEPVNENVEYAVVMRSRLGDHSLVYCAEVDGVDPKKYRTPHSDLSAFVELKTNKSLDTDRDIFNLHKYKMMKWWGQSYLVGIPTVICGFRDSSGIVHSLKAFQVDSLPSVGKEHWKPQIMKYFLSDFLAFIKKQVLIDDPKVVYKFERKANGGHIICKYLGKDPNWSFLPQWYYKEIFQTQTELSK